MNHQGLRWTVHCVPNVGLRIRLNLYKRGFKIYDLLAFFASRGLDLHSAVLKIAVNHATWDAYSPKAFETWIHGQCYGYYFLYCVWTIFSFGVMEAFDSKGIINTLEKYYVSQLECVDLSTSTFATWQIRSCLLCKYISTEACPLCFPSIFRSFRQENRIVGPSIEASSEIGTKMKSLQAKQRTCKDYVIGREITTY